MKTNCNRSACKEPLTENYYEIWNQGNNSPRQYCVDCGRKIIEANKDMLNSKQTTIELKFERH